MSSHHHSLRHRLRHYWRQMPDSRRHLLTNIFVATVVTLIAIFLAVVLTQIL